MGNILPKSICGVYGLEFGRALGFAEDIRGYVTKGISGV